MKAISVSMLGVLLALAACGGGAGPAGDEGGGDGGGGGDGRDPDRDAGEGSGPGTAKLRWQAPTTYVDGTPITDLAGYKVRYGTAPGSYDTQLDVGNVSTYTIAGLVPGSYYFTVTAYNALGDESAPSNEATKVIP